MANPLNKLIRSAERAGEETTDVIRMLLGIGQNPGADDVAEAVAKAAPTVPAQPGTGVGAFGRGPLPQVPEAPAPTPQQIGGLGWQGTAAPLADEVTEALPSIAEVVSPPARTGYVQSLLSRLGIGVPRPASPSRIIGVPSGVGNAAAPGGGLGSDFARQAQESADEAASADAARQFAAIADDASGGAAKVDPRSVKFGEPSLNNAAIAEEVDAAKAKELAFMSGRMDGLRNQSGPMAGLQKAVIADRVAGDAQTRQALQKSLDRSRQIGDVVQSAKDVASKWGGPAAVAAGVGAGAAGLNNLAQDVAQGSSPATTADLAASVPSISATPDESQQKQPSYMDQNPGALQQPAVTPEQRAKAEENFRASQDLENYTNRWAGSSAINEAVDRVLGPIKGKSQDEDRRLAAMASDQDLAHMEEMQRQEASNGRMAAMAQNVSKPQAQKRQASMDVLPSDNLAAVEQELTPEPMVKSKPKPLASASAYDDPTGTRFNQLIQSLAVKNGMTPEQARAIYQENSAKGLSPRQAMQPLIDMGQAAFKTGEANRMGNVARAAMFDPRNPRRESNAFGMMSPDDQQFAAASRFIKNPGISPRDVAQQKFDAELRAREALAARENELEKTRVLAQGPVNQAMWAAGGQVVGAGLGAIGNYFQTQAALQAAAQEQASRERAAEIAAKGVVDAAGKHNEPRPPTVEDKAKAEQMEVQTEGMKKSMDKMTEAEKYKQGDARHRVEGGTEAILRGAFRTAPAVAALQELAKQATNSNSKWGSDPGNKAESFDQSLKLLGLENEMLRKQLTEEYIGRPTTNPLGAGGGAV